MVVKYIHNWHDASIWYTTVLAQHRNHAFLKKNDTGLDFSGIKKALAQHIFSQEFKNLCIKWLKLSALPPKSFRCLIQKSTRMETYYTICQKGSRIEKIKKLFNLLSNSLFLKVFPAAIYAQLSLFLDVMKAYRWASFGALFSNNSVLFAIREWLRHGSDNNTPLFLQRSATQSNA